MVLGAGGSARAAVWALLGAGAEVMVWNRTPERARELCSALGGSPVAHPQPADVLVNCTAVGLVPGSDPWNDLSLSPEAVRAYACVVDVAYGAGETELIAAAREAGAAVVDGLEVLVRQGALSLEQWTGMTAPLDAMRAAAVAEPGSRAR
jgi:shikimate dehydrogenase